MYKMGISVSMYTVKHCAVPRQGEIEVVMLTGDIDRQVNKHLSHTDAWYLSK